MAKVDHLRISNRWLVEVGEYDLILSDQEITDLAQALAFRLDVHRVESAGSGIVAQVGHDSYVHLCFSDEADEFVRQVREAERDFLTPATNG